MKRDAEWLEQLRDNSWSWTQTIHSIQADAMREAAKIALKQYSDANWNSLYIDGAQTISDAILAAADVIEKRGPK